MRCIRTRGKKGEKHMDPLDPPRRRANKFKGHGTWERGGEFFRCKAMFLLDPDGDWRLSGFELFQPYQDPDLASPLPIPTNR